MSEKTNTKTETKKETTQTKTKKTKTPRTWSSTKILDCLAYFAIMLIALALILHLIFREHSPNVANAFHAVGECLSYIILSWLGFYWTLRKRGTGWNKRNIWWLVAWIVATVLILIFYIFTFNF